MTLFLHHMSSKEHDGYALNNIDFGNIVGDEAGFQSDFSFSHDLLVKLFLNNENHAWAAFDSLVVQKASRGLRAGGVINNMTVQDIDQVRKEIFRHLKKQNKENFARKAE